MIDAEKILRETYPDLKLGQDNKLAKKLLHEDDFNQVIEKTSICEGLRSWINCLITLNSVIR